MMTAIQVSRRAALSAAASVRKPSGFPRNGQTVWGLFLGVCLALVSIGATSCSQTTSGVASSEAPPAEVLPSDVRELEVPPYQLMAGDTVELLIHFDSRTREDFLLSQGDLVEVKFIDTPELNQEQPVRADGKISLPYIGDVSVANLGPDAVREEVQKRYAKEMKSPQVVVLVKASNVRFQELKNSFQNAPRGQSRLIKVRPDGVMTFPLLGDINVTGMNLSKVSEIVNTRYRELDSSITTTLLLETSSGSRFSVLGAVNVPGYYIADRPITLFEAVAMASGFRNDARVGEVLLIRRNGTRVEYESVDMRTILKVNGVRTIQQVKVNDVVYVPRAKLAHASDVATYIGNVLFFRGADISASRSLDPRP
ncbi:MAG: polysaccharide biosynthesis/export family protein [Planctomycetota bacterium]